MLPRSLSTKNRKRLLRDLFYTFDTHAGFVMTSLLHPAGHKMAALTVLLSCLSSFFFNYYYYYCCYYYYYFLTKKKRKANDELIFYFFIFFNADSKIIYKFVS